MLEKRNKIKFIQLLKHSDRTMYVSVSVAQIACSVARTVYF